MQLRTVAHFSLFSAFFCFAGFVACSSASTHDSLPPACTADCGPLVNGSSGGGSSSGGDGAIGDAFGDTLDGAPAAVTVSGNVTEPVGIASDPRLADAITTTVYTVSAASLVVDGGATTAATLGGTYTLPSVEITTLPTWFEILNGAAPIGFVGMSLPDTNTSISGIDLPVYSQSIVQATASAVGQVYDDTKATIVIRVVTQSTGSAVAGATANGQTSGIGPYYDSGANVNVTTKSTATNGTIVFLNVTPNSGLSGFAVNVAVPAVGTNAAGTVTLGLIASAGTVTYYLLQVPG